MCPCYGRGLWWIIYSLGGFSGRIRAFRGGCPLFRAWYLTARVDLTILLDTGNGLRLVPVLVGCCAGMAEWLKRRPRDPVWTASSIDMTAVGRHALVGSNPTPGAITSGTPIVCPFLRNLGKAGASPIRLRKSGTMLSVNVRALASARLLILAILIIVV